MAKELDNGATTGWLDRGVSAWRRFWFTPADPAPLALMRIVTGLLVIYVFLAYCFDLEAFFGPKAWYDQDLANRIRRTYPLVLPSRDWKDPEIYYRLPIDVGPRKALRAYLDNLFQSPPIDPQIEFLRSLAAAPDERAALMRWLKNLPDDTRERDLLLQRYATDKIPPAERDMLPGFLIMQPTAESREQLVRAIQRFLSLFPKSIHEQQLLFTLFQDMSAIEWQGFMMFTRELPSDEKERKFTLDYLEFWNIDPKFCYRIGLDTYSPWFHVTDRRLMWTIQIIHIFVAVLFTVGLWTRVTSVLTWLACLAYVNRSQPVLFGQDTMMNLCLFYLMLAPCGAVWSLDWLINRYRSARTSIAKGVALASDAGVQPLISAGFVLRLLQVQYCLMYLSAGLAKLKGNSWWTGAAPMSCLANPEFAPMHMAIYRDLLSWLCDHRLLWEIHMSSVVVFTLIVEIGFPTLIWTRLRPLFIAGALILHLGIAVIMGLTLFSLFMFALLICWIPADVIRWFFARRPADLVKWRLKYQSRSPEQAETAARVHALDVWNQVDYSEQNVATVKLEPVGRGGPAPELGQGITSSFGLFKSMSWLPGFGLLVRSFLLPRINNTSGAGN